MRIGLISDTHGLLRPEVRNFLIGCEYIVHAGDIGERAILDELTAVATVIAVKGNNDKQAWASNLRETELVRLGSVFAYVLHDLGELDLEPVAAGVSVVISGHSHQPKIAERDGVLYINPGSCGPQRFKLPVSFGEMRIQDGTVSARIVDLTGAIHAATAPLV